VHSNKEFIQKAFQSLYKAFGPQHWWPADGPFEVMVGAILTQNTNWKNVEKAITALKSEGVLEPGKLLEIPQDKLAILIKPAGYFNIKAKRLKEFVKNFCMKWNCSIEKMKAEPLEKLRSCLLQIKGIGPETADSILLYALQKPVFVVDAYTKRILSRHGVVDNSTDYQSIQQIFQESLPRDHKLYNEYHALIVRVGKTFCRKKPLCERCPLRIFLP